MKPTELKRFESILVAKQREILGSVISMEDAALRRSMTDLSTLPIHWADLGTDNYEVENTLGLMESERSILEEIVDALDRIQDGTYGVCEQGGEPIPIERLEAIPWARCCVRCASRSEGRDFDWNRRVS
jgi:RNA polymerase-binding protein DksA